MTTAELDPDLQLLETAEWYEPAGVNPRGTVVVITGRGETPEVYERFGRRLSADAYRVIAVSAGASTSVESKAEIARLVAGVEDVGPRVLVGSDLGARAALELAATDGLGLAGLVTAGITTKDRVALGSWDAEIDARTACPTHHAVLARTARGSLFSEANSVQLRLTHPPRVSLPTLAFHGSADTISPLEKARAYYAAAGVSELVVVDDGRHDLLNDVSHRSVAAEIVQFLEQLRLERARLGNGAPTLLTRQPTGTDLPGAPS